MEEIKPTTVLKEKEAYLLEDKDYLFIRAIQDLTQSIKELTARIKR